MKVKTIKDQKEFDKIKVVKEGEEIIFESDKIKINHIIEVFGILRLNGDIYSSFKDDRYIISKDEAKVFIVSWESSQNSIKSYANSQNSIESWENSHNSIESYNNSQNSIKSRESSQNSIKSWENSHNSIESYNNSQNSIVSYNQSTNTIKTTIKSLSLYGYSVAIIPFDLDIDIKKEDTAIVQRYKEEPFLKREGIEIKGNKVVLYKRVSHDFKTQEGTKNETNCNVGNVLEHSAWDPTKEECGEGKFHAVSKPYFGDEFRNISNDKYIAIEIEVDDLYEWKNAHYIHKIAFKKGKVLYECDKFGKEVK